MRWLGTLRHARAMKPPQYLIWRDLVLMATVALPAKVGHLCSSNGRAAMRSTFFAESADRKAEDFLTQSKVQMCT